MNADNTDLNSLSSFQEQPRNLTDNGVMSSRCGDGVSLSWNDGRSTMTTRNGRMVRFGTVSLPASKSVNNRALMIAAYGCFSPDFQNLSNSNDTQLLKNALLSIDALAPAAGFRHVMPNREESMSLPKKSPMVIDIADCGTAARFLTTYLACHEGDWLLTGTKRMCQRPMAPLVDALRLLGAAIQYTENQGCLPLRIKGKPVSGGKTAADMTQSSQYASSLLLAGPMFPKGLELELLGELNSLPYLDMTLNMLRHFMAQAERHGRTVVVKPQLYQPKPFSVEPDWTAASYWYEMAAFSEECEIRLRRPNPELVEGEERLSNLQGDAIIAEWMKQLGVGTFVENDAIVLRKVPFEKRSLSFDFSQYPDLYPTMAATCAGLQIDARFTGLDNLAIKESNRVEAMQMELSKLRNGPLRFCAHNDHRIVMALAPLSMLVGPIGFDHPEVVEKSYPNFWADASFLSVHG